MLKENGKTICTIRVFVKPLFTETIWFIMIILTLTITTMITVIYITYYIKRLRTRPYLLLQYIEQNMRKKDTDNSSGDHAPLSKSTCIRATILTRQR